MNGEPDLQPPGGDSAQPAPGRGSSAPDRRPALILGLSAWVLLSAIVASQNYVEYMLAGAHVSFLAQAAWTLAVLSYWLAAAPVILLMYRRVSFEGGRLVVRILVHVAMASLLIVAHAPLVVLVTALLKPFPVPPNLGFWRALGFAITYSFHTGFLLYWVILGSGAAYASYRRARERQLQSARLQVELGRARLGVLEAQIRPHFLFNALNAVAMLIRAKEDQRAVEMVAHLGELLRESLKSGPHHEVRLAREVELAGRYLHVERCRFGQRLKVEVDIPAALERAMVPHLVLQPLVENAVRHGISRSTGQGVVRIAAAMEGEQLVLEVHDNGPEGPPAPGTVADQGSGVGLDNVRSRLEQLYGPAGSLSLERRPGEGTVARIAVPYHLEERLVPAPS